MDILMIGHSRVGKTSFMAGLYRTLGNRSNGFGVTIYNKDDREQLQSLANNLSSGSYPQGNDFSEEYKMWLKYGTRKIIPFNWTDYRGGALTERARDSQETEYLIEKIIKADALIAFIDGDTITEGNSQKTRREYDKTIWLITTAINARYKSGGDPLPVSFVITKGDKLPSLSKISNMSGYRYFDNLKESISNSSTAIGMETICSVTSHESINVFPPLLFSLFFGMDAYIESEENRLSRWREKLEEEEAKLLPLWYEDGWRDVDEFVTGFFNIFRDKPHKTDYELSIPIKKNIENQKKEIDHIERQLHFLESKKGEMSSALMHMIECGEIKYLNKTLNPVIK